MGDDIHFKYLAINSLQLLLSVLHRATSAVVTPSSPNIYGISNEDMSELNYRKKKKRNNYVDAFINEIGIVQFVLLGDVSLGKLGQFDHFGNDFLFVVGVAEVDQRRNHTVNH